MLERATYPEGPVALVSSVLHDAGFLAAFTERVGGVSEEEFRSLNLGLATADVPEHVIENRRRVSSSFGLKEVAALRQVHGSTVVEVDGGRPWGGPGSGGVELPAGDVLVTEAPGVGLVVLTADCVPIALADPVGGRLAVVHAGWRGLADGVVQAAVSGLGHPGRSVAAIGPAVGVDHYEVSDDVAAAVSAGTDGAAVVRPWSGGGRPSLDLPGTVAEVLRRAGVGEVDVAGVCTACETERFFSYRRDGRAGRQALVAARLPRG